MFLKLYWMGGTKKWIKAMVLGFSIQFLLYPKYAINVSFLGPKSLLLIVSLNLCLEFSKNSLDDTGIKKWVIATVLIFLKICILPKMGYGSFLVHQN